MELFTLNPIDIWGDYGDVLISGFSKREVSDSPALLERSGSFLPPISFPGDVIVVSNGLKLQMEALPDARFIFRKAIYEKIIPIDWHRWNKTAEAPKKYPKGGEPENYLLKENHSPETAQSMETPWELILPEFPCVFENHFIDSTSPHKITREKTLFVERLIYPRIFRSTFCNKPVVDAVMKVWLQKEIPEWVKFYPLTVVHDPTAAQRLIDQRNYYKSIGPHLSYEEYRERALDLCGKKSYAIPVGFQRRDSLVSRYCVVCTDVTPAKLSAQSYDSYGSLENYILHRQRVSSDAEGVLSNILIYDLETGNQMKYIGNQKFTPLNGK